MLHIEPVYGTFKLLHGYFICVPSICNTAFNISSKRVLKRRTQLTKAIKPDKNSLAPLRPSGIIANKSSPFIAAVMLRKENVRKE